VSPVGIDSGASLMTVDGEKPLSTAAE